MAIKKTIEIEIKDNVNVTTDHFEDLNDEIKAVKKQADDLSKSFESNGDAIEKSFKPLKAQFREAQQQVAELSEKFGATSKEAINAAKRAAELKDAIGDAKDLTDAFNPDAKFNALSNSIGGVLNGFQAFEGTLGLIGVESEDVQKTLLKVQSAMALSQGLQGVMEAKDSFKQLGAVIGQTAIGQKLLTVAQLAGAAAMRVLNAVMAANPILLVVGAIGAMAGALKILRDSQDDAANKQRELNRQLEYTKRLQQSSIDTTSEHVLELKKLHDNKLRLAEAEGKSSEYLTNLEIANKKEILRYYNLVYSTGGKLNKAQMDDAKQLRQDIKILEAERLTDLKEKNKKEIKENKDTLNTKSKDNKDFYKELQDLEDERFKLHQEATYSDKELEIARLVEQYDKKFEIANGNADLEKELEIKLRQEIADINAKYNNHEVEETKKTEDKKVEIIKATEEQKLQAVKDGFSTIGSLAQLFAGKNEEQQKRAFKVQKAANIANTLIDTYSSATKSYNSLAGIPYVGPVLGFAAAAAAVAAGLVNVKNISQQQFESASSSGGGGGTPPPLNASATQPAPSFNIVGNGNIGQLASLNQAPVQAYVVSGEVTSQQALDRNRLRNATF